MVYSSMVHLTRCTTFKQHPTLTASFAIDVCKIKPTMRTCARELMVKVGRQDLKSIMKRVLNTWYADW